MIRSCPKLTEIVQNGFKWFLWPQMDPNELIGTQMVQSSLQWAQMIPNNSKRSQMVLNCRKWFQMIPNSPKWSLMVSNGLK